MLKPTLQPMQPPKRIVLTVSQLNQQSKRLLETNLGSVWLTGEISNLTTAASGHWYFSLKDNSAQISCAMFRFKTQNLQFRPSEGDKVVVKGKVSLYEARGNYQLIADYMEPAGLGDLQQKLNLLMQKLQAQGLFSPENKKNLPNFPKQIGVITSPTGAAIHDVLTVLQRRCPMVPVVIYPTQVQGIQAVQHILAAIDKAELRNECDVLLITRGGGSLEDLWCFNDELLAQRIAEMSIPVVAAIGHEVDTTITELVADLRAATPSAAAELLVPEQIALQQKLDMMSVDLSEALNAKIDQLQTRLNIARLKLADPDSAIASNQHTLYSLKQRLLFQKKQLLQNKQQKLQQLKTKLSALSPKQNLITNQNKLVELKVKLKKAWLINFEKRSHQLHIKAAALDTLSPLSTLTRGYTITRDKQSGNVLTSVKQLSKDQRIRLMLKDGEVDATVN